MQLAPIGIVGLGQLGRGIAACLLAHGFEVVAFDTDPHSAERARGYIGESIPEGWADRFVTVSSLSDFRSCQFVIESVLEDLAIKSEVFDALEAIVGSSVPIASNTSALPITLLQSSRRHPERFLGMHWLDPAYVTRFLELIRGDQTSDAAFASGVELALALGKEPALVQKDVPGFVANRLAYAMYREAAHLLETGVADAETIDRAFHNSVGLWASFCGPLRWIDITGGPWLYAKAMQGLLPSLNNSPDLPATFDRALRNQDQGVKNGRGFYSYEPADAAKWAQKLRDHAWRFSHQKTGDTPE